MPEVDSPALSDVQAAIVREAARNGGRFHDAGHDPPDILALIRARLISVGDPAGQGWHHLLEHGRQWLARTEQESQR